MYVGKIGKVWHYSKQPKLFFFDDFYCFPIYKSKSSQSQKLFYCLLFNEFTIVSQETASPFLSVNDENNASFSNAVTGLTCSETKDICKVAGCHPDGTEACTHDNITTYECVCKESWEGELCDKQVTPPGEKTSCICPTFDDPLSEYGIL